ncbi:hypothetical protein HMPREF9225_0665 [Peptoniphilus duerdenii ATCC BAA-1640]|uniref:Uncharacterized protein n=1 Tax=Peptoniphilus duerdenii ATCC BAA-1640 TaxID=862517 RepID=E0NKH6_9FIRM|nr:hypothetical protein HMPREF9225_0665 [Peptoniphilus duerdenii ATCC BAA-1640]
MQINPIKIKTNALHRASKINKKTNAIADCFIQSATPLGKQVASHLLRLTTFVKLGVERIA